MKKTSLLNFLGHSLTDMSTLLLILSNVAVIFLALIENWDLSTIMFIYWCQSVIIGFFTFFKILNLKNFTKNGNVEFNFRKTSKLGIALFFAFHYGFFHFTYLLFLMFLPRFNILQPLNFQDTYILLAAGIFFVNHLFSFLYNRKKDAEKKQYIGKVMMFPYIRIIPMHITIIFGSMFMLMGLPQIALVLFLILKMLADVIMHKMEHRI